ncbi:hypothetical protein DENSPDRAFT_400232 [Dentipellis sp. KUC8613]|nr:hypothetical protein DENSPDRAFT_400232 [Dentipellis sp. KUC8613]
MGLGRRRGSGVGSRSVSRYHLHIQARRFGNWRHTRTYTKRRRCLGVSPMRTTTDVSGRLFGLEALAKHWPAQAPSDSGSRAGSGYTSCGFERPDTFPRKRVECRSGGEVTHEILRQPHTVSSRGPRCSHPGRRAAVKIEVVYLRRSERKHRIAIEGVLNRDNDGLGNRKKEYLYPRS